MEQVQGRQREALTILTTEVTTWIFVTHSCVS
jgi:hypothetical protein